MRQIVAVIALLSACGAGGDEPRPDSETVGKMPDVCKVGVDDCESAKGFAEGRCSQLYLCDPTYQDNTLTCYAAEWAKLCESGMAARVCGLTSYQKEFVVGPCAGKAFGTCGADALSCVP